MAVILLAMALVSLRRCKLLKQNCSRSFNYLRMTAPANYHSVAVLFVFTGIAKIMTI
jgi:hypothetical protein